MASIMYAVRNDSTGLFVAREGDAPPVPYTEDLAKAGLFAEEARATRSIDGLKSHFDVTEPHTVVPVRLALA